VSDRTIRYKSSATLARFHRSNAFVRGVRGPVGSGKSTGMSWEMFRRGQEQAQGTDDRRHTRWVVVRNTYRELMDTTLKTWLDWFPESELGPFNYGDMSHRIAIDDLDMEVLFRALDRPDDIKKLLSLELTGGWVNEAREVPKAVIDALTDRVGRYPAVKDGGCTWSGVVMDTNSPDTDHWWYRAAEEERPAGWEFFAQPGGLVEQGGKFVPNPSAENVSNLPADYYTTRMAGKARDYILVYYANQYGFVKDGKPVYPDYVDDVHCGGRLIEPIGTLPMEVGIDFGLTPAAVFGQKTITGQWRWIDELVTEDMDAARFAEVLRAKIQADYNGFKFKFTGDPAGDDRAQTDSSTCFEMLRTRGIDAYPASTNDPAVRQAAVGGALRRMVGGQPGLIISTKCAVTRKGMAGGYAFKRVQVAGAERFHDKPDKNKFSHPCEAAQYLMLGGGEGEQAIGTTSNWGKPIKYPANSRGSIA
jgi:hypothetical protein